MSRALSAPLTTAPVMTASAVATRMAVDAHSLRLFIFERLDEGAADRRLGGPESRDERGAENRRNQRQRDADEKGIIEAHPCDIAVDHLQHVIEVDRARRKREHQ